VSATLLWQPSLPDLYHRLTPDALAARITDRRRHLADRLVILGHHYQTDAVIRHADLTGDSLKLSQQAAGLVASRAAAGRPPVEFIIFCGVHFMAETADILTPDSVQVILPDLSAGCSMADMAQYDDTLQAWDDLHAALATSGWGTPAQPGRIIPITYVNSSAAIKAFVGAHGGACCTSSNADHVFAWAHAGGTSPRAPGEDIKILFLPDQHLGRNTAHKFGVDVARLAPLYDPRAARRGEPLGGLDPAHLPGARVILWAGHCSVHKLFRPEHCDQIRALNAALPPGQRPSTILVHPECSKEVVDKADLAGSTEYIINTIAAAPPGSRFAVGTEHNLVNRLRAHAAARSVEVRILSDCQCLCTTMSRIDEPHLAWVLDGLCGVGTAPTPTDSPDHPGPPRVRNVISVHPVVRRDALLAVNRMLDLVHQPATID
jgi:quinolinate synthase